ncbi:sodium-translocating pyrophosphatase [Cystobacter fuscus]|uniref:K(+)-insensitive pyrophosphate-energized proton pump n=1 Tax=Cystobacter fuscus TaxID=43 RepID=A0A250IW74_9BACT|nr:sodium-translocating pyrophosphatase [Cystobacter fuscus]ATB35523.1 sodium-translocating pyrophosphatase [Cystobacter fuscus]
MIPTSLSAKAARILGFLAVLASSTARASEADLILPDFRAITFLGGAVNGATLLMVGIAICIVGLVFGFLQFAALRRLPVHKAMLEISELIYATCQTYLVTQGKLILILEVLIGAVMVVYFGFLRHLEPLKVIAILVASLIGIAGSYGVAWFGIRVNTFANSRTSFASLRGKPYPTYAIPLQAGISIGMVLVSVELLLMLLILLVIPADYAGSVFIGFAIGESLGASVLRIAGGIFTKIADIGSDLMKIVFKIKEDDARNPGVIADCAGDNAGDSVGPSADGFETYGVTSVALITFILLAVPVQYQAQLLVWIFMMSSAMVLASLGSYFINGIIQGGLYKNADQMNFEKPLTVLVWLTSGVSVVVTFIVSWLLIPDLAGDNTLWLRLSAIVTCGTLAGAIIPEAIKVFTSTESRHVREVVTASREGGASLNVISGLVAGNFSGYWMGIIVMVLMGAAYYFSLGIPNTLMIAPAVFAFGLVAFGFLSMAPVTIAVDSYGPVTDNAQSVYELSLIENVPNVKQEIQKDFGFAPDFDKGKDYLEQNDGAGNTFKATSKPVLIGTAVVGATTMIFSIIVLLVGITTGADGLRSLDPANTDKLSLLHAPFLLGLIAGGAIVYWFSGASMQAVSTGAYRAVEFIKANIRLEGVEKASVEDSKRVVAICTQYAQKGMINIFLGVFCSTLAFACFESFFFVGYLISIAIFGLYQALFMANAGGAWDNAKKLVEVELKAKGSELHAATVVGDTVGDPFKDTSSVALNPVIKFTTLFGLLAVELAVELKQAGHGGITTAIAAVLFVVSFVFVYRSFYGMRIETPMSVLTGEAPKTGVKPA